MKRYLERIISSKKNSFTKSELYYADYFLSLGDLLLNKTISNLALETNSSTASIFKFIKKLGFKGYKDFQLNLASNQVKDSNSLLTAITNIDTDDEPEDIANKVVLFNIQSLHTLLEDINNIPLNEAIDEIKKSETLHFYGVGGSSSIAFDCYHKFLRTNKRVNYIQDLHIQLSFATKLNEDDLVFVFSHSGDSKEPIAVAKEVKKQGARLISLTGNPKSDLAKVSDVSIILPSLESTFRSESLTARISYLTIMDSLFVSIMYKNPDDNKESIKNIRNAISVTKK